MSEYLTRDPGKQARLKEIIGRLHGGATVAEVKRDFDTLIKGVSAEEVAAMEQALVDEGFPVEEIQRLCEVHVAVFESSLEKGHKPSRMPGHPVHSFMAENREAERLLGRLLRGARAWAWGLGSGSSEAGAALGELAKLAVHYARKENQLFPYLERHGFTGPPKVMWGKHDEARVLLKGVAEALAAAAQVTADELRTVRDLVLAPAVESLAGMIDKEQQILLPMCLDTLDEAEWGAIAADSPELGWCLVVPETAWAPAGGAGSGAEALAAGGTVRLPAESDALAARGLAPGPALEEIASLFHRLAVAQVVPAATGSFDDAERVRALAERFTPEAVQLHYQIATQGRVDLALAPDEATGMAMALLRMLAFVPVAGSAFTDQGTGTCH